MSYGYEPKVWKEKARQHWQEFQPTRFNELSSSNQLEDALDYAVEQTWAEMQSLINSGFQEHEAWEMVRENYLFVREEEGLYDDEELPVNVMHEYNQWLHEESVRQNEEWLKQFERDAEVESIVASDNIKNKQPNVAWLTVLRWIIMLPAALVVAYLASRLAILVTGFGLASEGYSNFPLWTRFYLVTSEHVVLGMAFVFTAVGIAPSHKHIVGISTSVFTLLLTGFLIYPMLRLSDYWALWGAFCLVTSVIVSTINVYRRHR